MGRTPCCNEAGLKKGAWTAEEDHKLTAYIQEHGEGGWRTLPLKAGLQRCGKSCRLRWTNYLRPDIKRGMFSSEEEQKIIQLHAIVGNKWSAIARHLHKRTDNEIKNFWNTHLKKRLTEMGLDHVSRKEINGLPLSSSNYNDSNTVAKPSHMAQPGSTRFNTEFRLGQPGSSRPRSGSAKLLNKIAAKLAPMQYNEMATTISTPLQCIDAIKSILLKSTKCSISDDGCCGGEIDSNNINFSLSASELLENTSNISRPFTGSHSTQILNRMATKLAPSNGLGMLKDRLGVLSRSIEGGTNKGGDSSVSNTSTGGRYNNIESPISISDMLDNRPTSELTGGLGMGKAEVNEAFTVPHQLMEFASRESPICTPAMSAPESAELDGFFNTCINHEVGTTYTGVSQDVAFDSLDAINKEATNIEDNDFVEKFTNFYFGNPNGCMEQFPSNRDDYHGAGSDGNSRSLEDTLNYSNNEFDLVNFSALT